MANKYDLKTWNVIDLTSAGGATGTNIGSSVIATGKTRFLTYIRVTRHANVSASVALASLTVGIADVKASKPDATSVLDAAYLKLPLMFPHASRTTGLKKPDPSIIQEIQGSIEHPILSIAGNASNFMGIHASLTAGEDIDVFAQYYDE